jgi:hypothetical protein
VWRARDPVTDLQVIEDGDERRHKEARLGDSIICPFECDDCAFYRLFHRWPTWSLPQDKHIGGFIRQANLDMFWAREASTTIQNFREFVDQASCAQEFGYRQFEPMGPFSRSYDPGMRAAIGVLMKSQKPGRHEDKIKFSAARKARSIHTNMYKASAKGCESSLYVRTDKRRSVASKNPTDSEFFSLFIRGLENRVGQRVKRDQALAVEVVVELQRLAEEDWAAGALDDDERKKYATAQWACFFLYAFCHSVRGWEVVQATLERLRSQFVGEAQALELGVEPHIGLPLYGRFKSCGNSNAFLLCMIAAETDSGLAPGKWTKRLLDLFDARGPQSNWVFQHPDGSKMKMADFNDQFYDAMSEIQARRPDLIPPDEVIADT